MDLPQILILILTEEATGPTQGDGSQECPGFVFQGGPLRPWGRASEARGGKDLGRRRLGRSQGAEPDGEPRAGERRRARQTSRRAPIPRPEIPVTKKPNTVAEMGRIPETCRGAEGVGLVAFQRADGALGPCDEGDFGKGESPVPEGLHACKRGWKRSPESRRTPPRGGPEGGVPNPRLTLRGLSGGV
jgi:hypothetical protein